MQLYIILFTKKIFNLKSINFSVLIIQVVIKKKKFLKLIYQEKKIIKKTVTMHAQSANLRK